MSALVLTPAQRKALAAQAHSLSPVVMVGSQGLSSAVLKEMDSALNAHALMKVRVLAGEREEREAILTQVADTLNAAAIAHIGKVLVLWRPPKPAEPVDKAALSTKAISTPHGPREVKVLKYSKRGGQRPQVKRLRVLGNQRLTAGGKVKRARPVQKSLKKQLVV